MNKLELIVECIGTFKAETSHPQNGKPLMRGILIEQDDDGVRSVFDIFESVDLVTMIGHFCNDDLTINDSNCKTPVDYGRARKLTSKVAKLCAHRAAEYEEVPV